MILLFCRLGENVYNIDSATHLVINIERFQNQV